MGDNITVAHRRTAIDQLVPESLMGALGVEVSAVLAKSATQRTLTEQDHPVEAPARWTPRMAPEERERLLRGWRGAVRAAIIAAHPEDA